MFAQPQIPLLFFTLFSFVSKAFNFYNIILIRAWIITWTYDSELRTNYSSTLNSYNYRNFLGHNSISCRTSWSVIKKQHK